MARPNWPASTPPQPRLSGSQCTFRQLEHSHIGSCVLASKERTNTVTLPTLQPPATPVNATMTGNLPSVTITTSLGVVLCSNSATPLTTASAALVAAGHDPSTYIKILGQSGNPFWWGQLIDMINTAAQFGD